VCLEYGLVDVRLAEIDDIRVLIVFKYIETHITRLFVLGYLTIPSQKLDEFCFFPGRIFNFAKTATIFSFSCLRFEQYRSGSFDVGRDTIVCCLVWYGFDAIASPHAHALIAAGSSLHLSIARRRSSNSPCDAIPRAMSD
jgi:hypothetical protein